jgi:hypothetical protein
LDELPDDDGDDLTPEQRQFLRAVARNDMATAESCLKAGVDVHTKNVFGRDAMQIAARNGFIPTLEMLMRWGGSIFTRGPRGDSLYHLATYNGHLDVMVFLQKHGIMPLAVDLQGQTAIHVACRRCEPEVLLYLHRVMALTKSFLDLDFDGKTPMERIPRVTYEDPDKVLEPIDPTPRASNTIFLSPCARVLFPTPARCGAPRKSWRWSWRRRCS